MPSSASLGRALSRKVSWGERSFTAHHPSRAWVGDVHILLTERSLCFLEVVAKVIARNEAGT